ncbi:MAG: NAD(P)/FAD-dependent oxidoreductase [Geminicoccaceae bacterium]
MQRFVIIGAGHAGAQLCASLRKEGFAGEIVLIGDEGVVPYQRPPLSKGYLKGEVERARLWIRPESFYADERIDLRLDDPVIEIDRDRAEVVLRSGARFGYDRLALATGAHVRTLELPGHELEGVVTIRTLADIDAMRTSWDQAARVVVIGAGFIGLEAAAVAAAHDKQVVVLEKAPRALARVVEPKVSEVMTALHRAHGVDLRFDVDVSGFVGEHGRLTGISLGDGQVVLCELAVVGIGVIPASELAEAAGLACDNGVVVDACCRTSDPAIFAAGDVTRFPSPFSAAPVRLESVQNAVDQAKACALAMLDRPQDYVDVPWFWSDQYDVKLQIVGLGEGADTAVWRAGPKEHSGSLWSYTAGRLTRVDAIAMPQAYVLGKRWIEKGQSPNPDAVADPASVLKEAPLV